MISSGGYRVFQEPTIQNPFCHHSSTFDRSCLQSKQKKGVKLVFETIEQKATSGTGQFYEAREPILIVISRREEAEDLSELITDEAIAKLEMLDFSSYFELLVLQGWKPTSGYSVFVILLIISQ